MNTIKIHVFHATQPIGNLYVAKIDAIDLLNMSTVDRRHIDEDDEILGIQRPLRQDKVNEIKKYLSTQKATFPNSIIVNVKKEYVVKQSETELEIEYREDAFTIIDGQHRLYGFEGYNGSKFELILTIFIGLEVQLQSEVFSIINSQQTKVDPSLNINLELQNKYDNPQKKIVQIAQTFNSDPKSAWFQQIRMLGSQSNGIISLASFVRPIFNLTYPEKLWIEIKNRLFSSYPSFPDFTDLHVDLDRYPFWNFYVQQETHIIYRILSNYFNSLKEVFKYDWLNDNSILNKTTGYNAIIKLLVRTLPIGIDKGDLSEAMFVELLSPLSNLSGSMTSEIYGSSGLYSSNLLYRDMLKMLNLNDQQNEYRIVD